MLGSPHTWMLRSGSASPRDAADLPSWRHMMGFSTASSCSLEPGAPVTQAGAGPDMLTARGLLLTSTPSEDFPPHAKLASGCAS